MTPAVSRPRELHALNGLRGVPALAIVLFHYCEMLSGRGHFGYRGVESFDLFVSKAYLFVDFFFVLSGFILAYVHGARMSRGVSAAGSIDFTVQRIGRLYPVHLAMILAMVLFEVSRRVWIAADTGLAVGDVPGHPWRNEWGLLANLALVQAWHLFDHLTWNPPAWFVSAEFALYLLFPFLIVATGTRLSWRTILAGLIGIGLLMALAAFVPARPDRPLDLTYLWGVERGIGGFLIGIALQAIFVRLQEEALRARPVVLVTLVQGIVVVALMMAIFVWRDDLTIALLMGALVFVFAFDLGPLANALRWAPLRRLGQWSFGIYMGHVFLISVLLLFKERGIVPDARQMEGVQALAWTMGEPLAVCAGAVGLGFLLFRFVEEPGGRAFKRWLSRPVPESVRTLP